MSEKHKLVPVEPTQEMIDVGRTARTHPAERYKAMLAVAPDVRGEPVEFCEDAALSIAERMFGTEVDERLASDIIRYAQRLHSLYAAPKREEQRPAGSDKVRAEFEAWANSFFANAPTRYKRDALPKDDPNYGDYAAKSLQAAWLAWQASRAAPDVAGLVTALEDIDQWVSRWASADHPVAKAARKALATYRDQGGDT